MRFFKHAMAVLTLGLLACGAGASPANPQAGKDYRVLQRVQQPDAAGKVEVIEFFWYGCPHCNAFDPTLHDWVKKQGENVDFKRVPVNFRTTFVPLQKLYYTLEAMGRIEEMHSRIFRTIHVDRQRLDTDDSVTDWAVKQGLDKEKFLATYNSFAVQGKVRRAAQLQQNYGVDGVPLLAVDGRFLTSPSIIGESIGNQPESVLFSGTLQVADWLVTQAAKNKQPAAPASK